MISPNPSRVNFLPRAVFGVCPDCGVPYEVLCVDGFASEVSPGFGLSEGVGCTGGRAGGGSRAAVSEFDAEDLREERLHLAKGVRYERPRPFTSAVAAVPSVATERSRCERSFRRQGALSADHRTPDQDVPGPGAGTHTPFEASCRVVGLAPGGPAQAPGRVA